LFESLGGIGDGFGGIGVGICDDVGGRNDFGKAQIRQALKEAQRRFYVGRTVVDSGEQMIVEIDPDANLTNLIGGKMFCLLTVN